MQRIKQILPKEAYYKSEWFEKEKELIFEKEWQFICMLDEFEENNSFRLEDIGNSKIIITLKDEKYNAFHNLCRHRGIQLLHGKEKLKNSIICPYHNWSYTLDGALKGVPQQKEFENMDKKCMGLTPVQCEVWEGMLFVNLDENAKPLHTTLSPIKNRVLPYDDTSALESNDDYSYIINANWKIFIENYMDVYHLLHIHKESLKEYDHKNSHNEFIDDNWLFYQPLTQEGVKSSFWWDIYSSKIPSFNGSRGAYVSMLFPNFGITATENMCMFISIKPLNAEETEVTVRIKSNSGSKKVKSVRAYDYRDGKNPIETLLAKPDVMNEDIYACEMIQRNIKSRYFKVSALAQNYEKSLYDYQSIIKKKLSE